MFSTDKIGLACYLMLQGVVLTAVQTKNKSRAIFIFQISPQDGLKHETAYTTSEHSRFFEAFKYLRNRAFRGE